MKKIIVFITLLTFGFRVFSQDTTGQSYSRDYYLQKSKNQRTGAWVLLGIGTGLIITGMIAGMSSVSNDLYYFGTLGTEGSSSSGNAYTYLLVGGIAMDIASIPLFISAGKNNRRATELAIGNQNIYLPKNNSIAMRSTPAITFRIHF